MNRTVTVRGDWPGAVALRSGWSLAHARPWNDDLEIASLRIDRGNAGFVRRCAEWLLEAGAPSVVSIPLHAGNRRMWEEAGFLPFRQLRLMERDLSFAIDEPRHPIRHGGRTDLDIAAEIDREAFEIDWRIGRLGLVDAAGATPRSRLLMVDHEGRPAGFAIVGVSAHAGYLQRIAVRPSMQGHGYGRSLVRATLGWAKERGANTMLLNTQNDNDAAAALYRSERFETLPDPLYLLRMTTPS